MKLDQVVKFMILAVLIPVFIPVDVKAGTESITTHHRVDRKIGVYYTPDLRNYEYLFQGPKPELYQLGPGSIALFNTIMQSTFQEVTEIDTFPPVAMNTAMLDGILVPRIKSFVLMENKSLIPVYRAEISYEFNLYKPDGKLITSWEVTGSGEAQSKPLFYHPLWPGLATDKAMEISANKFMESFETKPDLIWWSHAHETSQPIKNSDSIPVRERPLIGSIMAPQVLSGGETRGLIWVADITSTAPIDHIWAVIIPPAEWKQTSRVLSLEFNSESNRYEGNFMDFTLHGDYRAAVFARDAYGLTSSPISTTVTQTILSRVDAYEKDNAPEQANRIWLNDNKPQRHNFYARDDVDWVFFVALKDVDYGMKIDNYQENGRIRLELYDTDTRTLLKSAVYPAAGRVKVFPASEPVTWTAAGTGPLYIKAVQELDGYGAGTDYDLVVYRPNLPRKWVIQSVWNNICTEANTGHAPAQLQLAYWHRTDLHHPKAPLFRSDLELDDRVSYMWYRLAEKNGAWGAKEGLEYITARLSPGELAEAEQMFHDWKPGQCPSPTNIKYGHVYQD